MSKPLKVFITYSHKDTQAKDELETRLAVLQNEGMIDFWHDNEITPGKKWRDAISSSLADSDLLLYLVSDNSLASENCNRELAKALTTEIRVIPIILENCNWLHHQLSSFQALPDKGIPISEWNNQSEGWQNVVDGIRKTINTLPSQIDQYSKTSEQKLRAESEFQHGNTLLILEQLDMAIRAYSLSIELDPNHATAYNNRGAAYGIKGEYDKAIRDCAKAIELKPDSVDAYNNRGAAYSNRGEHDKAIRDYNKALEFEPDNANAYQNRGNAFSRKHNYDLAIRDYNKAIHFNSNDARTYNNRGVAYFYKGEVDRALEDYTKAIELNTKDPIAYYNRGEVWLHLREWEKTKADLITAQKMGMDIIASFRNEYKNVEAFEKRYSVKLPEDIALLLTERRRTRYPKTRRVLDTHGNPVESPNVVNLREQLRNTGISLGEYLEVKPTIGINTYPSKVFVVDRATRGKLIASHHSSVDILKPFLQGRDLKRWHVDTPHQWLIFTYRGIAIDDYPAILKYLKNHIEQLNKRRIRREWYELSASVRVAERFEQPKLVCPYTYNHQTFAVDAAGYYYGTTSYLIPTEKTWLCGLLNSRTVEWFYSQVSDQLTGAALKVRSGYIQQIPIPDLTPTQKALIAKIVDYLIYLQQQPTINSKDLTHARDRIMLGYFERVIEGLVYEAYLTEELHKSDKHFFQPLLEEQLPLCEEIEGDKMTVLRDIFELLYERTHPIRRNLYYLDSVKSVRIIEGKL
ncbi:MAG: tetratricopeptide repeat protein [Candidatus Poribacteria bacterium]|nr:tetratricopeptide repeat protein [Candidatus Poribacteria bacterium]